MAAVLEKFGKPVSQPDGSRVAIGDLGSQRVYRDGIVVKLVTPDGVVVNYDLKGNIIPEPKVGSQPAQGGGSSPGPALDSLALAHDHRELLKIIMTAM